MSTKRPLIKFRDKEGKVKVKKVSTNYIDVWDAFRITYDTIVIDVSNEKYTFDDIVDIVFEHKDRRKVK